MIADFFAASSLVDTLLIVNSAARGQATPASDLDFAVLVDPAAVSSDDFRQLQRAWEKFAASEPTLERFRQSGRFTNIHLDVITAEYVMEEWDDGGGPDFFEVEIGNQLAYSAPYTAPGAYFQRLQAKWLPFYNEAARRRRLPMARDACLYDLEHVPHFVKRGLYFQAFDRLYKAHQEFLQALFISYRTYPIAYNKWIREQVENWLRLPDLYAELPYTFSISNFESAELEDKANHLRRLLDTWVQLDFELGKRLTHSKR